MAYGHDQDDDYQQLGMFHMITGVNVKIGENFKLPERISLPGAWRPSDPSQLLTFQYDFGKENEVIRIAEEERLVLEAQIRNSAIIEETPPEEPQDTTPEEEEEEESDDTPNTSTESNTTEILTPLVVPSEGIENKLEVEKKINVEEFEEDKNQNPFELVELQTLDEYDELRSVLEPTAKPTAKGKKVNTQEEPKTSEHFELDAGFFRKIDIATPLPSFSSDAYVLGNTDMESNASKPFGKGPDSFHMPDQMSTGTLNWTRFGTLRHGATQHGATQQTSDVQSINVLSQSIANTHINGQGLPYTVSSDTYIGQVPNSIPNGQTPVMMPCEVSSGYNTEQLPYTYTNTPTVPPISETVSNENIALKNNLSYGQMLFMTDEIPRTKSLPELQGQTEQIVNSCTAVITSGNNVYPDQSNTNQSRPPDDNVVSTDRIDSIMKQYQFQRLNNNLPAVTNYNSTCTQFSNVGGNMPPQYVGISGFPDPIPVNTNIPPKKRSNPPLSLPFDAGTGTPTTAFSQSNLSFSPMNSIPSPDMQNKQFNMLNQPPTSNFQIQQGGIAHNVSQMEGNVSTCYPSNNNPFMNTTVSSQNHNTQVPSSNTQVAAIYRHGILPPLPIERSHLADNFNPQPSSHGPTFSMPSSSQLTETDLRASQTPLLPSISPQDTPYPSVPSVHTSTPPYPSVPPVYTSTTRQDTPYLPGPVHENINGMTTTNVPPPVETLSWLVDPTEDLLSHEKNFAYQITSMGFPLPCVSRTIQRCGVDQKEVLDFLCLVEDVKGKDYHSDDVEVALVNVQKDKEKVTSYLQMVATFRELGFKPLQIHNALRETSVDQNKALDYLTSSR